MVVRFDVERFDVATAGKKRQHLLEEVLPGGSVQAGGVGDDTVHVEDDRRERRACRLGRAGVSRGVGHCLAEVAV